MTGQTLTQQMHNYLSSQRRMHRYNDVSLTSVRSRLASLDQHFGARPLTHFTRPAIEAWLESLDHLSPASRHAYLTSARQFCRWMEARGLIAEDPTSGLPAVRRPRSVPRALPEGDVTAALENADERERLICWLMVGIGLRRGEVARLRWEDYDERAGLLRVHGKAGHMREVGVPTEVAAVLAGHSRRRSHGPVIESRNHPGSALSPGSVGICMSRLLARAGVKRQAWDGISGHAFRHTCASDVLDNCHDLRVVQAMLGHQQLSSTAIYLRRAAVPQMREAMEGRTYRRSGALDA